jgi:hypothetical protein
MGSGSSQLSAGDRKGAELVFFIRYLVEARAPGPEPFEFARLAGTLEQGSGQPSFVLSEDWDFEYTAAEAPDDPARYLLLGLRAPSVIQSGPSQDRKLPLPAVPTDARYLELSVEVRVDGALEGEHTRSDLLDVPLHLVPADVTDRLRLAVGLQFDALRLVNRPYRLTVDGTTVTGIIPNSGEILLPRKATSGAGLLEVQPFENANTWYSWELDLGSLAPVEATVPSVLECGIVQRAGVTGQARSDRPGTEAGSGWPRALRSYPCGEALGAGWGVAGRLGPAST